MTCASCKDCAEKSFSPHSRKTRNPDMRLSDDEQMILAVFKSANTRRIDWHGNCIRAGAGFYTMLCPPAPWHSPRLGTARALAQPAQLTDISRLHIIQISVEESAGGSCVCNQAVCYARSTLVQLGR